MPVQRSPRHWAFFHPQVFLLTTGEDCAHALLHGDGEGVQHMEQRSTDVEGEKREPGPQVSSGGSRGLTSEH